MKRTAKITIEVDAEEAVAKRMRSMEERIGDLEDSLVLAEMDGKEAATEARAHLERLQQERQADRRAMEELQGAVQRALTEREADRALIRELQEALENALEEQEVQEVEEQQRASESGRGAVRSLFQSVQHLREQLGEMGLRQVGVLALCARLMRMMRAKFEAEEDANAELEDEDREGHHVYALASETFARHVVVARSRGGATAADEACLMLNKLALTTLPGTQPFRPVVTMECAKGRQARRIEARIRAHFEPHRVALCTELMPTSDVYELDRNEVIAFWGRIDEAED